MKKSKAADAASELATLFPAPETVTQGDLVIPIPVLPIRKLGQIASIIAPLIEAAPKGRDLAMVLVTNIDATIKMVAIATDIPEVTVGDWDEGLFTQVLTAVVMRNQDFFRQTVLPLLTAVSANAAKDDLPTGPTT